MRSLPGEQLPTVFVVVLGIALAAAGIVTFAPGQPAYHHDVETITAERAGEIANDSTVSVTNHSALSPAARTAFESALTNGGEATVRGTQHRPPEWSYVSDYASYAVVRYRGAYYQVVTDGGDVPTLATVGFGLSLLAGAISTGTGTWRYRTVTADGDGTESAAVAVTGVLSLLGVGAAIVSEQTVLPLIVAATALILVVSGGTVFAAAR